MANYDNEPTNGRQRIDFNQRTSAASWRASKAPHLLTDNKAGQFPMRGSVRAFDAQYYGRGHRRYGRRPVEQTFETNKIPKQSPVIKTTVQNLNLEYVKPQRAGVIIYTVVDGAIYFGLGLDSRTHDLTDFGGGVTYRTDLNCVRGALREFDEETLSIFEPVSLMEIQNCPALYDNRNLIIFIHIKFDPETVCQAFNKKYKEVVEAVSYTSSLNKQRDPEVCGITWLNWEQFQQSIKERGVLYSRVQRFLARADNFAHLL